MRRALVLLVVSVVTPALGAPKVLAVATGDCRQPELLAGMTRFSTELRSRWQDELFVPEVVLDLTRPRPSRSLEDVQRQVESAKTLFYGGQAERALDLVKAALTELDKVPATPAAWPIAVDAYLVQAQAFKSLERKTESADAFKRVLRVEPSYKLDPDFFTPSTIAAFEGLRREVQKGKKSVLQVQSTPPGAEVFIEGRSQGKTPFKQELPAGSYRIAVANGESVSFPRTVTLPKDAPLQIDLAFEGALSARSPLCLQADGTAEGLAHKLALTVGAERVVMFWNERRDGPPFFKAMLSKVGGSRERDAGVEGNKALEQLASFIVTGSPNLAASSSPVAQVSPTKPEPAPAAAPTVVKAPEPTPAPPTPTGPASREPPPVAVVSPETEVHEQSGARISSGRIASFTLLGLGAASAIVGVIVYSTGGADRASLSDLTSNGKLPADSRNRSQALDLLPKVDANQRLSFGLIGGGAGLAVAGAIAFFLLPTTVDSIALLPLHGGAAVAAQGKF